MFSDFSAEREVEMQRVALKMSTKSSRKLLREVEKYFSTETPHEPSPNANLPLGPLVFRRIYKRYRKINEIAELIGPETPDEAIHQLRIECKKLRYLLEFFSELIPKEDASEIQKMLRRLQNRLGEFNDASVQQKSLMNYWKQKGSGAEAAMGLGGLVSVLYNRQQQTRGLIEQALEGFCCDSTAKTFKHIFKLPASGAAIHSQRSTQP
jgi:CHAD domain-containing protein